VYAGTPGISEIGIYVCYIDTLYQVREKKLILKKRKTMKMVSFIKT